MSRMIIGALRFKLAVFGATSLKDKRRVVKSLKERLIHKFNASVAEVGSLDHRQQAELGAVIVGNDGSFVESCLDNVESDEIRFEIVQQRVQQSHFRLGHGVEVVHEHFEPVPCDLPNL